MKNVPLQRSSMNYNVSNIDIMLIVILHHLMKKYGLLEKMINFLYLQI